MTPNHGYTPTDDRKREQTAPGQQPPGQQPQQGIPGQPAQQPQPPQAPPQQQPQQRQPGQPTQQPGGSPQQLPPQQALPQQPPQGGRQQVGPPQQVPQQPQPTAGTQQPVAQPTAQRRQPQVQQEPALKPLRVTEILTKDVVTAERDTPIRTVVSQMAQNEVGSVVVVEEDRPIGVITDRKVALALEEVPDIAQRTAEELVHGDVFTADPSMNIFDAIQVMRDEGIRRLPIVDDNGALRGIVTLDDALVLLGGVVSDVADTVQSQSPRL